MNSKNVLMICTKARGGMRSVVEAYERDGLFAQWNIKYLWTHKEGNLVNKLSILLISYFELVYLLVLDKISFMHVHVAMRGSFWRKNLFISTARLFNVPSVMHLHGSELQTFYEDLPPLLKRLVRYFLEKVETVVVLSESWRQFVNKIAPNARVIIINNYVLIPDSIPNRNASTTFNVLFLGILGHRKGIYDLLEAWVGVVEKYPNAKLLVGGNGEINQAIAFADKLGISKHVDFLGWVGSEDKSRLFEISDAFVLPSYNEGLPMSVLEAMSWKLPVVTTKVGGIPELIENDVNGLLIQPGDQKELTDKLLMLASNKEFRISVGELANSTVKTQYSKDAVIPKIQSVYSSIVYK